nr:cytochrome P450 monooxygenase CYP5005A3 [Tetrahymena thermophila]
MIFVAIYTILGILALIFAIALYNLVFYPYLRLKIMKQKYGDKIQVFFNIGDGILKKYKNDLEDKGDSLAFIRGMHQKNLKAIGFNLGAKVGLSFVDPDLIKQVHQNHDSFHKIDAAMAITFLFGNSILYAKGKDWQRQRQFLGKSFHFEEIKNYLPLIKEVCQNTFQNVNKQLALKEQTEIQAVKICEQITSEVVFRVFFGSTSQNLDIKKEDGTRIPIAHELVETIMNSFQLLQNDKIALIKWLLFKRNSTKFLRTQGEESILNRLITVKQTCLQVVIKRRDELFKDPSQAKKNFLDQYLIDMIQNKNSKVTYDEIVDNFSGLFFAGTDTTGNMTGVALYYLSLYPEIQQQAREEVIKVLSQKQKEKKTDQLFNQLTFDDLSNLDLINSILKESLRLVPPANEVFPRIADHDMKIGDFQIEKGDLVNTHFIYNQSNPEYYPNPDIFDPYRWMNAKDQQNTFHFTPFSLGPRNCIGQHLAMIEGKCMLASILLQFEILPNHSAKIVKEVKVIYGLKNDNIIFFKKLKAN